MAFVAIIFALLALTGPSLAQECNCPLALNFRGNDITQYGISQGSPQALKSVTTCFWMSAPSAYVSNHYATLLSYIAKGTGTWGNEFTLMLKPDLTLLFKDRRYRTDLLLADGQLHHVCLTRESSSRNFKVYKDGALAKTMADVMNEQEIEAGGIWVIGQDQDSLGGGFETRDSFKGNLTEVNIWNRALCPSEITRVAKDCGSLVRGNYKAYSDFVISNATGLIKPSCCPMSLLN